MAANFDFLKDINKNLYDIITEAEKLYRDEYFEQCMTQTRRFGEHVCKDVLGKNRTTEETFDEMLATLKDKGNGSEQEKEFVEDLYFLKKHGNKSVHSATVKKDGIEALECLQRAFEAAINYCVYNKGANAQILQKRYDVELLVTGKKNPSLKDKYIKEKQSQKQKSKKQEKKPSAKRPNSKKAKKSNKKNGISPFLLLMIISTTISLTVILMLIILSNV